jgi:glycerol dehydrogenase
LHGEKVAIGTLASLFLWPAADDERRRVFRFCRAVGLPTRLADVNVDIDDHAALAAVAQRACRPGEIIHNEPYPVDAGMVVAALKAMDRYAQLLDRTNESEQPEQETT